MRPFLSATSAGSLVFAAAILVALRPGGGGAADAANAPLALPFSAAVVAPAAPRDVTRAAEPAPRAAAPRAGAAAAVVPTSALPRFAVPVPDGVVPTAPELLPNSLREYRGGIHEGIDFPMRTGTPVYAAAAGRVTRIDYAYQEWSDAARNAALDNSRRLGYTPELTLDLVRGRQVWVDHGNGVVTRYAHLSAVAPLQRGAVVETGQLIGYVGQSGYPEGGPHLHFEIRLGDTFLGASVTDLATLRSLVARAFGEG